MLGEISQQFLTGSGREILRANAYRLVGIAVLAAVLLFCAIRRIRFAEWPLVTDCVRLAYSLLALWSAIIVGAVFLLTKPPAIEYLSPIELGFTD